MIYFKTLDGKTVRYNNKFNLLLVHEDKHPELMQKYYAENKNFAIVAVFLRIGKSPIWTVASYGEDRGFIIPKNYDKLPKDKKAEITNYYNDINEDELLMLKSYAESVVISMITTYCATLNPAKKHVVDIRKTFASDCSNLGYINMDMVDQLEDGVMLENDSFSPFPSK